MTSIKLSAERFSASALSRELRMPVTTISSSPSSCATATTGVAVTASTASAELANRAPLPLLTAKRSRIEILSVDFFIACFLLVTCLIIYDMSEYLYLSDPQETNSGYLVKQRKHRLSGIGMTNVAYSRSVVF